MTNGSSAVSMGRAMTREVYLTLFLQAQLESQGKSEREQAMAFGELDDAIDLMSYAERRALRSDLEAIGPWIPIMGSLTYDYDKQVWI